MCECHFTLVHKLRDVQLNRILVEENVYSWNHGNDKIIYENVSVLFFITQADVFNKITKPKPKALKKLERFGHADFLFPATKYRQRQVALSICLSPEKFLPPPLRSSAEPLHSLNVPGENHAQPEACHSIWPAATTAHLSKELIIGERR